MERNIKCKHHGRLEHVIELQIQWRLHFLGVDVTKDKGIIYPLNTNVGYQIFTGRGTEIPLLLLQWNTNTNL